MFEKVRTGLAYGIQVDYDRFGFLDRVFLEGPGTDQDPGEFINLNCLTQDLVNLFTHPTTFNSPMFSRAVTYSVRISYNDLSDKRQAYLLMGSVPMGKHPPKCPHCEKPLVEQVGRLRCTNTTCPQVMQARLLWLFTKLPIMGSQWDADVIYQAAKDELLSLPMIFDANNYFISSSLQDPNMWRANLKSLDFTDPNYVFQLVFSLSIPGLSAEELWYHVRHLFLSRHDKGYPDNILGALHYYLKGNGPIEQELRYDTLQELYEISGNLSRAGILT